MIAAKTSENRFILHVLWQFYDKHVTYKVFQSFFLQFSILFLIKLLFMLFGCNNFWDILGYGTNSWGHLLCSKISFSTVVIKLFCSRHTEEVTKNLTAHPNMPKGWNSYLNPLQYEVLEEISVKYEHIFINK